MLMHCVYLSVCLSAGHPSDWTPFLGSLLRTQAFCQFCDARISSFSLKDYGKQIDR